MTVRRAIVTVLCLTTVLAIAAHCAAEVLPVKHLPQFLPGKPDKGNNCCGPASLAMGAAYTVGFDAQTATIASIIKCLGLKSDGTSVTSCDQLVKAGRSLFHLSLRKDQWDLGRVTDEVAAGRPVVAGVVARYLPNRGYGYGGSHFVLVIGCEGDSIICNDPGTRKGDGKRYKRTDFASAFTADGSWVVHGFGAVSRYDALSALVSAFGMPRDRDGSAFTDVPHDSPHCRDVRMCQLCGIVIGHPDGTLQGKRAISRNEWADLLCRVSANLSAGRQTRLKEASTRSTFPDVPERDDQDTKGNPYWMYNQACVALASVLVPACSDGLFHGQQYLTQPDLEASLKTAVELLGRWGEK